MSDYEISDLERDYYLGNYQSCISKANAMPSSRESTFYMCLSYLYLKKFDNLNLELSKWTDQASELIKLYAENVQGKKDSDDIVRTLDSLVENKSLEQDDELSRIVASALYVHNKNYGKALQLLDRLESLVATYLKIFILITMNRGDLAEKKLAVMTKKDEQAPLTELAQAQVLLANRNPTHAWRIAGSLSDRFKPTPFLFNIQTAAAICLGEYDSAKQLCENSLDMDNDNLEALLNMVHILSKMRSSQAVLSRNLERLADMYPDNEVVRDCAQIQRELSC